MASAETRPSPPVAAGQRVSVTIESLALGGDGIAHVDGFTVFVPMTAPGDDVEVEIAQVAPRYARARVIEIRTPSALRVEPRCPHYGECGGCDLQHISYETQTQVKAQWVRDALARLAAMPEVAVRETVPAAQPWHYRNKAEFAVSDADGEPVIGYFRRGTHEVVAIEDCELQHPFNMEVLRAVRATLGEVDPRPALAQVIARVSAATGEGLAILVTPGRIEALVPLAERLTRRLPALTGVLAATTRSRTAARRSPSRLLIGRGHLEERVGEWEFRVSADSFFQTNGKQAAALLDLVVEWGAAGREDLVIDAYCGVGTFLVPLAESAGGAFGIEEAAPAFRDARHNLRRYQLRGVQVLSGRVETLLPRLTERSVHPHLLVFDPPRKGLDPGSIAGAARMGAGRVVVVSCDPATLARDLRRFAEQGYRTLEVAPVDMFPQTAHVEAVARLARPQGV
jgi:23S rRNA (uracil1939-C5)-methyltransferase